MNPNPVPSSLERLAVLAAQGRDFSFLLGDFLDGFYRLPEVKSLLNEPCLLASLHRDGAMQDAFLAAVAHDLANRQGWSAPAWTFGEARYLHRPYFPIQAASFRATLLLESPPAFRARNLFVTANALDRA